MRPAAADPRQETLEQRDDRNLIELLQELRVAGLGVQVLFGFLFALPFTTRFVQLHPWQSDLYTAILVTSAVATALLLGPVAYHRLVVRRRQKEHLVKAGNAMAIGGLIALAMAVSRTGLLVVSLLDKARTRLVLGAFAAGPCPRAWF